MNTRSTASKNRPMAAARFHGPALAVAAALCLVPSMACSMEIKLALMGLAGIEDPKFDVLVNDTVVGGGSVVLSAKSANGEYFEDGTDLDPYIQKFIFKVPDELATPAGRVGVRFLNDYYDGEKGIDANLYVVSVAVDGQSLDLASAEVIGAQDVRRDAMFWDKILVLPWYATATMTYGAAGAETAKVDGGKPAEPQVSVAPEAQETSVDAVADPGAPAEVADVGATAQGASDEVATEDTVSQPELTCASPGTLDIVYANGEAAVPPDARAKLNALASGGLAGCSVRVVGYSSPGGPPEINMAVSAARASEVEAYLRRRAPEVLSLTSVGEGETDRFGAGAENRRVVVTVE